MVIAIVLGFLGAALLLGAGVAALFVMQKRKIANWLQYMRTPPAKDVDSPIVQIIDEISQIFMQRVETRIKAQTMQAEGAVKRQENKLMGEAIETAISARSPWLGLLMNLAPEAAKKLKKSPSMAMAALNIANSLGGLGGGNNGDSSGKQLYSY